MSQVKAEKIVDEIIADLTDRKGFDNEWGACEESIREEIRAAWVKIVKKALES